MKVSYIIEINQPENHMAKVRLLIQDITQKDLTIFLPVWSPGSYMVREYSRHIRGLYAVTQKGDRLPLEQVKKNQWQIFNSANHSLVEIVYEVYCHELTVRTSHIDASHAFLHGPTYLMGVKDHEIVKPTISFRFPPVWSKISTVLSTIKNSNDEFSYEAIDYDHLLDCPVEIGCHETDGFMVNGIEHHLAWYGHVYPHPNNLKKDFQKIVECIYQKMGEMPYKQYLFLTHFYPKGYGGLEHLHSTALHFDGRKLNQRKDYLNFLSLVAHEYFHLWNVKRIRPLELGPFNYQEENYTKMLWLAEGLTSFVDNLYVYHAGLCQLEEYLENLRSDLEMYFQTPGKKFHSLEESSFNAWIKLYRPDENSRNSSISYYLKGGLVFLILHLELLKLNKTMDDFIRSLNERFKENPSVGVTKREVYELIENLTSPLVVEKISTMIETTFDIDFETPLKEIGIEMKWLESTGAFLGADFEFQGNQVFIKSVILDGPAYKSGLNAQGEILALNGVRVLREDVEKWASSLLVDHSYNLMISRLGEVKMLEVIFEKAPRVLKELVVVDKVKAEKALLF